MPLLQAESGDSHKGQNKLVNVSTGTQVHQQSNQSNLQSSQQLHNHQQHKHHYHNPQNGLFQQLLHNQQHQHQGTIENGSRRVEDVGLLKSLVKSDINHFKRLNAIIDKVPDWQIYEDAGILPPGASLSLNNFHKLSLYKKSSLIASDHQFCKVIFSALWIEGNVYPAQYILTNLYEIVRDDTTRYDSMFQLIGDTNFFATFNHLLEKENIDTCIADKSAFILSGLISRAPHGFFKNEEVEYFVQQLFVGRKCNKYLVSEFGRLDALVNILKIDNYRKIVWNFTGVPEYIKSNLKIEISSSILYKALFCVWLLSFNKDIFSEFLGNGIIKCICDVIKECRVEKVVRIYLNILRNSHHNDEVLEYIIDESIIQVLTLLEYEKWRDPDMYEDIKESMYYLEQKIKHFSNFTRYVSELQKGKLKWSFLHSEKFWHQNVMSFEQDEFSTIKRLFSLIHSDDCTTAAVVCHDLGEFARLHPAGKKVCERLKVKDAVMHFIGNDNRELSREALLCIQKLMLDNWEHVATNNLKT